MKMSDDISEFAAAFTKAQGMIETAKRDRENTFYKSKFADLASVREAIREPLSANDLSLIQFPRTRDNGVEIETMILHKSGQYMSEVSFWPANKSDVHGLASALTYGRRQAAMAMLGVAPDDDDGNAATQAPTAPVKRTPSSDPAKVMLAGEAAARNGTDALRDWYKKLSTADRGALDADDLNALKAYAVQGGDKKDADQ
jgi:hypothetical protein